MASPRPQLPKQSSSYGARDGKKSKSKGTVVIELPYSREYIPNSGPTPGAITLAPPADSTAYIIERILLPPDGRGKDDKPKPRRPTYIVGWRDLPGARRLVPVLEIMDYVSPWEVERWETELEAELSNERRKVEEKKKMEKEALARPHQPPPQQQPKQHKKRGRPPKNAMIETAAMAELEPEDDGSTRLKGGAMGFTPQKPQIEEFVGISDTDGTPSRQLAAEQSEAMMYEPQEDVAEEEDEHYETAEDEMDVDDTAEEPLNNGHMSFGNAQDAFGSLPPLELQQTNPDADPTPPPAKVKAELHSQTPGSSWVTAGTSDYKTQASMAPAPRFTSFGNPQLSKPTKWPTFQNDERHHSAPRPALKDPIFPKSKKQRPKSEPKEKAPKLNKRKRTSEGHLPVEVEGEQEWIVQNLEDAELYEVEGVGLVRYFKVLWEGDWPADQNPSWEPESNLPPALVRNYFKRSKDRLTQSQKAKHKKKANAMKQTTLSWGNAKKYDSVSQAFAGDEESDFVAPKEESEDPVDSMQEIQEMDEGEDELLVVDEDHGNGAKTPSRFSWSGYRNGILGM